MKRSGEMLSGQRGWDMQKVLRPERPWRVQQQSGGRIGTQGTGGVKGRSG